MAVRAVIGADSPVDGFVVFGCKKARYGIETQSGVDFQFRQSVLFFPWKQFGQIVRPESAFFPALLFIARINEGRLCGCAVLGVGAMPEVVLEEGDIGIRDFA